MTPTVPANDFVRQWEDVREDALAAVERVGASGWLVLGKEVEDFESELAEWWGVPYAVGVASGLDAITIGLRCVGVQRGTKVLPTPLTAFATTLAIIHAGAEPVRARIVDADHHRSLGRDFACQRGGLRHERRPTEQFPCESRDRLQEWLRHFRGTKKTKRADSASVPIEQH